MRKEHNMNLRNAFRYIYISAEPDESGVGA